MKKLVLFAILALSVYFLYKSLRPQPLPYETYYDCPSGQYSPTNSIPDAKTEEYKKGKCKVSNLKFMNGSYENATCTIQFRLNPDPVLTGYLHSGNEEGKKCVDNLFQTLKESFPNNHIEKTLNWN